MWGRSTRMRVMAVLAAVLLLGAACGGDDGDDGDGDTDGGAATGETAATGATGGDGGETTLQATNFAFSPATLDVAAGDEITIENAATDTPHTFTVDGTDLDVELSPGDSTSATIDLDPGDYEFECRFHSQMTGTLTVA